jgi:hypothetical protein
VGPLGRLASDQRGELGRAATARYGALDGQSLAQRRSGLVLQPGDLLARLAPAGRTKSWPRNPPAAGRRPSATVGKSGTAGLRWTLMTAMASSLNSSPARWMDVPLRLDAMFRLPGLARV